MDLHLWRGQGGLTLDKTTAGRCHVPPSICRHRTFLSDILNCSSGCLLERAQKHFPAVGQARGSGKVFQSLWAPGLTNQGFLCSLQPGGLAQHGPSGSAKEAEERQGQVAQEVVSPITFLHHEAAAGLLQLRLLAHLYKGPSTSNKYQFAFAVRGQQKVGRI